MIIQRFYHQQLAQASYLVGCEATREAVVIDPNRDVEQYLEAARREDLRIVAVTETHIHADFISGARELASQAGAGLHLSVAGAQTWDYAYDKAIGARSLHDGDTLLIGKVRLDVLHTPGHTPEHISFLVTDTASADRPMGIFTGDFLFVGDVGRPDLLEKAAGVAGTMEEAARSLFHSLQRLRTLPDYLQIWPGHGAGSACGRALGSVPQSTLGYERLFNWAFSLSDEQRFIHEVLAGQPEPPPYFAQMKHVNRAGPPLLNSLAQPERLSATQLDTHLATGAMIIDLRAADVYASRHIPGTINLPGQETLTSWAGWLLPYDQPLFLIGDQSEVAEAVRELRIIGLDAVAGYWTSEIIDTWEAAGHPTAHIGQVDAHQLRNLLDQQNITLIDVRNPDEHAACFIPTSRNIPLAALTRHMHDIPAHQVIVVHCQGGTRSAIAASLLSAKGHANILNLSGGFRAWQATEGNVERAQQGIEA